MRVRRILPAVFLLCSLLLLSACGKGAAGAAAETMAAETTAGQAAGAAAGDTGSGAGEGGRQAGAAPGDTSGALQSGAVETEGEAGTAPGAGQNEAVKETAAQTVSAFAERAQEACADRDLAALAELLSYPCQIRFADGAGQRVEKKGDLLAVDPDRLFTDSLLVSIANVDTASLTLEDGKAVMGEGKSRMVIQISKDKKTGISEIIISDDE